MILQARELVAGYSRMPVLHSVGLALDEGEAIAVIGPNGAGKSTLMKVLARQLPLMSGQISYRGEPCAGKGPEWAAASGIGYVPQTENVFGTLSVADNLRIGALAVPDARAAIGEVTERFPVLRERGRQSAASLSGGERQILAMCVALLSRPALLLLDEPTSGLAPKVVQTIVEWISDIRADGTSIVWVVEQTPRLVLERVERAYMLEAGQVKFEGNAATLLEGDLLEELFLQQV